MKKTICRLLVSAGFVFGIVGCGAKGADNSALGTRHEAGVQWNGVQWNGVGWNGVQWNGVGWNGVGWNGVGWNGVQWNGVGWNGTTFTNLSVTPDWGLAPWINDPAISPAERTERLKGLEYFTSCACGPADHLVWTGSNPFTMTTETWTFDGGFDLAPTWCRGTSVVPVEEQEAVSACLFSRVNMKGIHNPLSIRGFENSLALATNEKLFMAYPEGQLWGNIWDANSSYQDPYTGYYYKNPRAFACYFPTGTGASSLLSDLGKIIGRTCEVDGCGGGAKTSRECASSGSVDGSTSAAYLDAALSIPAGSTSDPAVMPFGLDNGIANGYQDTVTGTEKAGFYNRSWRRLSVFLGAWADLETLNWKSAAYRCDSSCGAVDGCSCYDNYCKSGEGISGQGMTCESPGWCNNCQTVVRDPGWLCGKDMKCKAGDCVRNHKLAYLVPGCWLPIEFTRPHDLTTGALVTGNANMHKAGTLLFRYAHPGPGVAGIQIRDDIRGTPIAGGAFLPTGSSDTYDNKYIYPIYPGRSVFTGTTPGIQISITGDPAYQFPQLDYAQIFVGPPFGMKVREMYWDENAQAFNPGDFVCAAITVEPDSDFRQAGNIRVRPRVSGGVDVNQLPITIAHNGVTVPYTQAPSHDGWSDWMADFQKDDAKEGKWEVCVNGAPVPGQLDGVDLELEQP